MALVFAVNDGTGDAIIHWYVDWSALPADTVAQGTVVDATLLVPPTVEPWQETRPYLLPGPAVEWRTTDKPADDPTHLFRKVDDLEQVAVGVDPWVAPTGSHDAYNVGDHAFHAGVVWRSTIVGNTVEPGTHPGFDWWVETAPPPIPDRLRQPLADLRPQVESAANVAQLREATLAILDTLTGAA